MGKIIITDQLPISMRLVLVISAVILLALSIIVNVLFNPGFSNLFPIFFPIFAAYLLTYILYNFIYKKTVLLTDKIYRTGLKNQTILLKDIERMDIVGNILTVRSGGNIMKIQSDSGIGQNLIAELVRRTKQYNPNIHIGGEQELFETLSKKAKNIKRL
jgi:hypothetical protein